MIIRPWDGEISLSGRASERYLLANFLRQISFVEINKVKRLNDSAFMVWCIWKKSRSVYEKGCRATGTWF